MNPNNRFTSEQLEARGKFAIVCAFAFILVMIACTLAYSVTFVEQPMGGIAPADKFNYDILKLIAVQIFSVLAILLGAKAMSDNKPAEPTAPQPEQNVTQTVIVDNKDEDDVRPPT